MSAAAVRRRRPALAADIRGIALQTVIIIVVLLVIAGGVSAVLLSRGQEAMSELELASIGGINVNNCTRTSHTITDAGNSKTSDQGRLNASGTECSWTWSSSNALASNRPPTAAECMRLDSKAVPAGANKCKLVFS